MTGPVYRGFGARQFAPGAFDRAIFDDDVIRAAGIAGPFDRLADGARAPFKGITTNGEVMRGLFPVRDTGISPGPIVEAARAFLTGLSIEQKAKARHKLGDLEQRLWGNAFLSFPPHGVLLEDADGETRQRACNLIRACLSARGFKDIETLRKFNAYLGELIGDGGRNLTEWMYYLTIFNEPSTTEPWGWQLLGHHLDLNCFVLGGQMAMTPLFLGSEPCVSDAEEGPYAGLRVFAEDEQSALDVMRSLDAVQKDQAVLLRSMIKADMPPHLAMGINGRMRGVTGADNLVLPYEGVAGAALSAGQRELLLKLLRQHVGRLADGYSDLKMEEVRAHLDQTYFAWVGDPDAEGQPFYYKVHSPVVLIEFDHHSGVFLDNAEPERFHAHIVVRTPNGNDYGIDYLRQHYRRFEHTEDGRHVPREARDPDAQHARAHAQGHAHSHVHGDDGHHHDHDPPKD